MSVEGLYYKRHERKLAGFEMVLEIDSVEGEEMKGTVVPLDGCSRGFAVPSKKL